MKTVSACAVAVLAGGVAAGTFEWSGPQCAATCIESAVQGAGCEFGDYKCICETKESEIRSAATPCVLEKCEASDIGAVLATSKARCDEWRAAKDAPVQGAPVQDAPAVDAVNAAAESGSESDSEPEVVEVTKSAIVVAETSSIVVAVAATPSPAGNTTLVSPAASPSKTPATTVVVGAAGRTAAIGLGAVAIALFLL